MNTHKNRRSSIITRIVVFLVISIWTVYLYIQYFQYKPIGWLIGLVVFLIFVGFLSLFVYKRKPFLWFSWAGLTFSGYYASLLFIAGVIAVLAGIILFIVYLAKDPSKLHRSFLTVLGGTISIYLGTRFYKFGRKITKSKDHEESSNT